MSTVLTPSRLWLSKNWPEQLQEMSDPPTQLHLVGSQPPTDLVYLTVIGSRRPSSYGLDICQHLISGLAGYPIGIVSGLALGIDAAAHRAALVSGLYTIAFPGSGLAKNKIAPRTNYNLAENIVKKGGSLISEWPDQTPAGRHTFPARNRLMAGLAQAILVIEAGDRSGTLITVRLALDYNRDILAVPGSLYNPYSVGTNRLIKEGAGVITAPTDILEHFNFQTPSTLNEKPEPSTENQRQLWQLLKTENINSKTALAEYLKWPPAKIIATLTALELEDFIKCAGDHISFLK
ncbi:MAG: DNA-processing protein DprA [Patescibacteria group bacterium]